MGIARLTLAGLAIIGVLVLLAIGGRALFGSLNTEAEPVTQATPDAVRTPTASPQLTGDPPTIMIECRQDLCATVFVRVPGGDVLLDREMAKGERVAFEDEKLDVVLNDSASVGVEENGEPRPQGDPGERESFTVTRDK
jgi:hypothetical protein